MKQGCERVKIIIFVALFCHVVHVRKRMTGRNKGREGMMRRDGRCEHMWSVPSLTVCVCMFHVCIIPADRASTFCWIWTLLGLTPEPTGNQVNVEEVSICTISIVSYTSIKKKTPRRRLSDFIE